MNNATAPERVEGVVGPGRFEFSRASWRWVAVVFYLLLTLGMFGNFLLTSTDVILSDSGGDLREQFVAWREFGFGELRKGNLALWNPHIFGGAPYLGGFQSALLYPPNWLYLILPLGAAINWGIALHVFLAGIFLYLWAEHRRLHPVACLVCGALWMFCGAHFLHIYAGHLPNLCTMVWGPLLFLAIDGMFERAAVGWGLLGTFAVAMQLLAGHPQYVFYTAVAAAIYCGCCFVGAKNRVRVLAGLGAFCVGAAGVAAVQLFAGVEASRETARSVGVSYEFASMFSFPPENFVSLLAPGFFGDMKHCPYWGRCYWWETNLFMSVTGLTLAFYGVLFGDRVRRRFTVTMVVVLLVLALGASTPLFPLLFKYVPGFDQFRGMTKFIFLASMFLILLAGVGWDTLFRECVANGDAPDRLKPGLQLGKFVALPLIVGIGLCAEGVWIKSLSLDTPDNYWANLVGKMRGSTESYLPPHVYAHPKFPAVSKEHSGQSLMVAGGTFLVVAVLLILSRRSRKWLCGAALLAVVEVFIFSRNSLATFPLAEASDAEEAQFVKEHPGDYRIFNLHTANSAMSVGACDIWGYDPGVLLRYAEFLAFTEGHDPRTAAQFTPTLKPHALWGMLRCQYGWHPEGGGLKFARLPMDALPRLQLVQNYRIETDREKIFAAMTDTNFNPRQEVILERRPEPEPVSSGKAGEVKLVDSSSDHLTIEARLSSPAILLVTDAYSKGWRARSLTEGGGKYEVMPGNYCLRAIPLGAGEHRLRLEYLPRGFVIGKWISVFSLVVYAGVFVWWWNGHKKAQKAQNVNA